jgi:hypothetical protein
MTWSCRYVALFCYFPHCQTTIRTHNFTNLCNMSVVTWRWGPSQTRLIMCWLPTVLKSLKPFITTSTARALITIDVFHHFMSVCKRFLYFEAKFNVTTLLLNISHLEYRKTHSTRTLTNSFRAMTNYNRMIRETGWKLESTPLGSTTYPTLLRRRVGALFQKSRNFLNRPCIWVCDNGLSPWG